MINNILIVILFIFSAIFQTSFVQAFDVPLSLFPLHFIIGVTLFQKANPIAGFLWFLFSALILNIIGFTDGTWLSYLITGALGIILTKNIFTSHSIYGLAGLALTLYTTFSILNILLQIKYFSEHILQYYFLGVLQLIIGIYIVFIVANYVILINKSLVVTRENRKII